MPTITLPIAKLTEGSAATKSTSVDLGIPELPGQNVAIGAMAHIDSAAAGNAPLAFSTDEYKEATFAAYRAVTNFKTATAGSYDAKLRDLMEGTQGDLAAVTLHFPDFRARRQAG